MPEAFAPAFRKLLLSLLLLEMPLHAQELPRVHILATGGTIASTGNGLLTAADLTAAVPELAQIARITVEDFVTIPSSRMTPEIQFQLAQRVNELLASDDIAGVVITHGTDSLEETAFFLDLLINNEKPVVFTAAQRPPSRVDTDGPRNLFNAVTIAANETAKDLGVTLTLNDEIHAARYARKTHTTALDAFQSIGAGPLGYIDEEQIHIQLKLAQRVHLTPTSIESRVDLIRLVAGSNGHLIKAAVEAGARGLVVEVFGRGNVPPDAIAEIEAAIENDVTVVIVSRTGGGRVILYSWAEELGVISGENLDGLKARMVLIAALGQQLDSEAIQTIYRQLAGLALN